jgi:hypothetical protein
MLVSKAMAAIGDGSTDDVVFTPRAHADGLPHAARALAALLRSSHVIALAERYERLDAAASDAQADFHRQLRRANTMVFVTAVVSGSLMAVGLLSDLLGSWTQSLLIAFGLFGIVAGAVAFVSLYQLKEGALLGRWMSARARAETVRLGYFTTLVDEGLDRRDVATRQLVLEYFRRYQLELQVRYYGRRSEEHRIAAERGLRLGAAAAAVASAGAAAAGLLGVLATEWAALAGVAVAATALGAYATVREAANQHSRNAERYARTLESLLELSERLDDVREAVAAGSRDALVEYVAAVHDQLSLEHRQWLKDSELAQSATARLEAALAEAKSRRE